jgi:hypothetical protein
MCEEMGAGLEEDLDCPRSLRLFDPNLGRPSLAVAHSYAPGPAADLAIFHVLLRRTAARIKAYHNLFAAAGTSDLGLGVENQIE